MSANITDYFNKASNMSGSYPAVATVTAARSTGGSTLSCDDLSSWATDTPVHFSTFKVNTDGTIDTATQTDWKGIVNGNTITDMTRLAGAADSGNASGDRVELNPTIGWLDDLITGILVSHKQNGALKDNAVTESSIATGAVTSSKVAAGAISSYDKIGDDVIQARNIDLTTLEGTGVIRFGNYKIMWGKATVPNAPSGQDSNVTVQFPEEFNNIPTVSVTCGAWIAVRGTYAYDTTKARTSLGIYHTQGRTLDIRLNWVAVG